MGNIGTKRMVNFTTTRFGLVEVDEDKIIKFVDDIPGFSEAKQFILVPHAENSPFSWLQSVELPDVAFAVTDPWLFFEDYKPVISEVDLSKLKIEDAKAEDIVVLSILTIPSDPYKISANLQAPVIINAKNNTAKQVVLLNENYATKHLLLSSS